MSKKKSLLEIHEDVPADHYDQGIKKNLFQKYWHFRRFVEVLKVIKEVEGPILDVGCHSGTFTQQILKKIGGQDIYGIDVSRSAIALAKKRLPFGHFEVADAVKLPFKNSFFSGIFCLEMMEHVDDPRAVLKEIKRVAKAGSRIYILVPSENKLFQIIWFLWTLYYRHWSHAHVQHFSGGLLEQLIKNIGFKIIGVKTFHLGMLKLIVAQKI
ncbi:MAG: class I SAM-dependent methyltransferase [Candidatus Daviesbacteria bacterium]|nr:MAG: class I SAM-dependent methyltransferase [Candidatus Daviesbacteria bacterium]